MSDSEEYDGAESQLAEIQTSSQSYQEQVNKLLKEHKNLVKKYKTIKSDHEEAREARDRYKKEAREATDRYNK